VINLRNCKTQMRLRRDLAGVDRSEAGANERPGSGDGNAVSSSLDLSNAPNGGTDLTWSADGVVHGMIASVGARLLTGFAEKQTQRFFERHRGRPTATDETLWSRSPATSDRAEFARKHQAIN
jgi:hypothetical protein